MAVLFANSGDPDQTPHSVASELGLHCLPITLLRQATVAQLDAPSDWRPGGRGFNPRRGFKEIDNEILFTVILSLPLIQEGQLSLSGERIYTILVNHLED